jgi:hypothetical protein
MIARESANADGAWKTCECLLVATDANHERVFRARRVRRQNSAADA